MARIRNLPREQALTLPVQLNGQIMPGDVDRFRFRAIKGQQLVIEVQARSLIPYLADAVPGWFQATLALYDARGKEVAFADDYRFNPDPVLFYKIPENGDYELEIRDSIYRGRQDFVYRVAVSERPFITRAFPLGARMGDEAATTVAGWNLPQTKLAQDTQPGGGPVRQAVLGEAETLGRAVVAVARDVGGLARALGLAPVLVEREAEGQRGLGGCEPLGVGRVLLDLGGTQRAVVDAEFVDQSGRADQIEALRICLEELTPRSQKIVRLRYGQGMKGAELAEVFQRPLNTIYVAVYRIHRALADCIRKRMALGGTSDV